MLDQIKTCEPIGFSTTLSGFTIHGSGDIKHTNDGDRVSLFWRIGSLDGNVELVFPLFNFGIDLELKLSYFIDFKVHDDDLLV